MTVRAVDPSDGVMRRLWAYQSERFPLIKTSLLLGAFSAASINVSAFLGERSLPPLSTYAVAFAVLVAIFFQMRACDEVKDAEDDRCYRPERPIPRGLVSLRLVVAIATGLLPMAVIAAASLSTALLLPLLAVWIWLALMTVEFGAPEWLRARPMLYLVSHMLIMPLVDLFVTAAEWLVRAGEPPAHLWIFLVLSFVNGCVLEIGRKLYAPSSERPGVETYTSTLGVPRATVLWLTCATASFCLLIAVGIAIGAPKAVAGVGLAGYAGLIAVGLRFMWRRDPQAQKLADTAAGLWVFVCYMAAGFAPLVAGGAGS